MNSFQAEQLATRRLRVADLHPSLMCLLCGGYYVDATTIIECLHSFCKSCLVRYLESNKYCPICEVQVHKTKPLLNIRSDETLQNMVYKLVPGLFHREMKFRQEFYAKHPEAPPSSPEDMGVIDPIECQFYYPEEPVSLALEFKSDTTNSSSSNGIYKRYLRCPAAVTVAHLQKLVRNKYDLSSPYHVEVMFNDKLLMPGLSIMDVAYSFQRKRKEQFNFTYRIVESPCKKRKLQEPAEGMKAVEEMKVDPSPPALASSISTLSAKSNIPPQTESKSKLDSIISRLGIAKQTESVLKKDKTADEWKEVQLQISESGVMSVTDISSIDKLINTIEKNVGPSASKDTSTQMINTKKEKKSVDCEPKSKGKPEGKPEGKPVVFFQKETTKACPASAHAPVPASAPASAPTPAPAPAPAPAPNIPAKRELKEATIPIKNEKTAKVSESVKMIVKAEDISSAKTLSDLKDDEKMVSKQDKSDVETIPSLSAGSVPSKVLNIVCSTQQNIPIERVTECTVSASLPQRSSQLSVVPASVAVASVSASITSKSCTVTPVTCQVSLALSSSSSSLMSSSLSTAPASFVITKPTNAALTTTTVARTAPVPVSKQVPTTQPSKKVGSTPVGYKTLKCGPKNWNPTISRNSFLSSKTEQQPQQQSSSGTGSSQTGPGKPATPPRFFKMRNTPRYLGNPASGVKAMYQIPDSKPETPAPAKSPSVTKVDPRTLSPIVSNASSPTSKSPVQPKGRPPFPSTTLSAQVSNHMPSSRSVATTTSSSATKHTDLSSLRNSPTQSMVNPFLHMPNFLFNVSPGLLPSSSQFASMLRPGLAYPPGTVGGFHPTLPQSASMLFNPHQLHRPLNSSSPGSPTGYPSSLPSSPSLAISPSLSASSSSSSLSSSKSYTVGQRLISNCEKVSNTTSSLSSPSRSNRSTAAVLNSGVHESSKVNGLDNLKNSTVNQGKSSLFIEDHKAKAFSASKDVQMSSSSASDNNNTLSLCKTKLQSEKMDLCKLPLDVSNLVPKESGKCGDQQLISRSKTSTSTSFSAQQS